MESVMLNTNVYGRPFDDLKQKRIFKEALDSVDVLLLSILNFIIVKTSDILFAELSLIKDKPKRERGKRRESSFLFSMQPDYLKNFEHSKTFFTSL